MFIPCKLVMLFCLFAVTVRTARDAAGNGGKESSVKETSTGAGLGNGAGEILGVRGGGEAQYIGPGERNGPAPVP